MNIRKQVNVNEFLYIFSAAVILSFSFLACGDALLCAPAWHKMAGLAWSQSLVMCFL